MATKVMSSSNHVHTQMMKFPKFVSRQTRVPPSSCSSSYFQSGSSSCPSPCSVLPAKPNKKRPLSPEPQDQKEVNTNKKKMKLVEPSSPSPSSIVFSPAELHAAQIKVRHADIIFKAQKEDLEKRISDPVKLQKALAEVKRKQLELKERVEAYLREEKRKADEEAKRKEEEAEKERLEWIQRQRRSQRRALERCEAVAKSKIEKPCCCSLKELGIIKQCHYGWSWGCWGGQRPLPLEQLGFVNKEGQLDLQELEEGEIR